MTLIALALSRPALALDAPAPPARLRIEYVDGLRALAALYVMLHHAGRERPDSSSGLLSYCLSFGHLAVALFIVLSGYCLMLPVVRGDGRLRGGLGPYFRRRARRILPPYYAALAVSLVLVALLIGRPTGARWDDALPVRPFSVALHALLVHNMSNGQSHKINYVFWSIAIEWQLYFVFPMLVVLWRRLGAGWATLLGVAVGVVGSELVKGTRFVGLTPLFLGLFSLGMLAAALAHGRGSVWEVCRRRVPWGALALAGWSACVTLGSIIGVRGSFGTLGVGSVALLVHLARKEEGAARSVLGWGPLVAVGGFSYSLYLLHAPLHQVILQYVLWPLGLRGESAFLALVLAGGPAVMAAAYGFHLIAERPFMARPNARTR